MRKSPQKAAKADLQKFQILYLLFSKSIVSCRYSGDEGCLSGHPSEPGVVCVTGLPARTAPTFVPSFFVQSVQVSVFMRNWMKRRWILGMVVAAATVVSYAQWSNPADDVPAYHPSAPLKFAPLPAIMAGNQLTGQNFRF